MVLNAAINYHAVEYFLQTLAGSFQVYIKKDKHILTTALPLSFLVY